MTIRWYTDADREDVRDAAEERRLLDELVRRYAPGQVMTAQERAETIANFREWGGLRIDPYRRS